MDNGIILVLIALFAGSVGSVLLAGLLLLLNDKRLQQISTYLAYLAGGTLLGATFLGMIPKATSMLSSDIVLEITLAGILFFFILEKIILWRTCRNKECERHLQTAIPMILIGDAFHNAIDGIVIAASFLTSTEMGVFVTLSVIFHEIPQELGDFGILLKGGMLRSKALLYNALSGSTAIIMGVIAYYYLNTAQSIIPYALAFSASSFLYIALADLIPEMHKKTKFKESAIQILIVSLGILLVYLIN
ncbi:MAG: ZIP family metal transporter [Bacteroidales bacterium]|nr:ZIP family metal transporter [Bacteroidales bacterium]